MKVQSSLHRAASGIGIDLVRYRSIRHAVGRRARLLEALEVDLVFDVGANRGQFAKELRRHGYRGQIISFEPLSTPRAALQAVADQDPRWTVIGAALGSEPGTRVMNVAVNTASSSFLPSVEALQRIEPRTATVAQETVVIERLDDVAEEYLAVSAQPYLKLDVQGYERHVLDGAPRSILRMVAVQIELSLVPSYEGAMPADEAMAELAHLGFALVGLEPGLADPLTGVLLETDGIFVRHEALARLAVDLA